MKRFMLLAGAAAVLPSALAAQGQRAAFIVTLGTDTVAVERFTRSPTTLEGDVISRTPRTRVVHYVATLDGGRVRKLDIAVRQPPATAPGMTGSIEFRKDTASVDMRLGDSLRTIKMAVQTEAVPMLGNSFGFIEQSIMQALASGKDSFAFDLVPVGPTQPRPSYVARRGRDSMTVDYFGLPGLAHIDASGRLLGYDGRLTTVKVLVHRVADADIDALLRKFAALDASGQSLGQLSTRDTVNATVGDAHLVVDYGRPLRRGRTIFGDVVPYNQVWRTGANAATQLTVDKPVVLGGLELAPATYTLWTLPTPGGAKLIINKQHGQWGTDYDESQDLARIDLTTTRISEPVERFTIAVVPAAAGSRLVLTWETTQYSVAIGAK